jgi:predicted Holliday junction resolvase-like endonuclease
LAVGVLASVVGLVVGVVAGFVPLRSLIARRAQERFERWQGEQLTARTELSVLRSQAVLQGQMVEHLVPMFDEFTFGHLADARFLGKPVDFIVFDGYTEVGAGAIDRLREIVFVDVKTGRSRLNNVERAIRDCVDAGRVRSVLIDRPGQPPR